MTFKDNFNHKSYISAILSKIDGIKKWQYNFLVDSLFLFLSIKGRINFTQLARYGRRCEQHYRNQFSVAFDFFQYNLALVKQSASTHLAIAFDPCYIPKSGKCTTNSGHFWSGVARKAKWGLEIGGLAIIDMINHTAFHLEAIQTPKVNDKTTLLKHYTQLILARIEALKKLSKYIVVDAYFSKYDFVILILDKGLHTISRLRSDADLRYLYQNDNKKKPRGRPREYDGKVFYKELSSKHMNLISQTDKQRLYEATIYCVSLKRKIKLALVQNFKKGKWKHKLYFSTDLSLTAQEILEYYQKRFQIEFVFRDAKQHTGLNNCQARSQQKLHTHFNLSLTAVNIAKAMHWIPIPKEERKEFSMAEVKTQYNNRLMLGKFFSVFAIKPNLKKNKDKIREILNFGSMAA